MIESICIKNVATYNSSGIYINGLKKINFIYGANGCGKTTISNFILDKDPDLFKDCTLNWGNNIPLHALVYNKKFRDKNFGHGKLNGIFTLGEATADQIREIEEKNKKLLGIKNEGITKKETKEQLEEQLKTLEYSFKEDIWIAIYKKHENTFKEAFKGFLQKESFKNKILQEYQNNKSPIEAIETLQGKAKTIFGDIPKNMPAIPEILFNEILGIENEQIWQKIIIGKSDIEIAKLIQTLNISDWVNQGKNYIQGETCPFCQQKTITESFQNQINDFFDKSYAENINLLNNSKQEYERLMQNVINHFNQIELNQKNLPESKLEIEQFSAYLKILISQYNENKLQLEIKIKEPSRSVGLTSTKEQLELISDLISTANQEIAKHNSIAANYENEKQNLIRSVWKYLSSEYQTEIDTFNKRQAGLTKGISNLSSQLDRQRECYKNLDAEIRNLSKNLTSIQPSIDEINRLLESYGFTNFKIVPSAEDGFYQIHREDGSIAENTLSEGEITFITFLYYLHLAKGGVSEDKVNDERILVIDDPISSLDSNILFIVSTLIKEIIKEIKLDKGNIRQLILLTHNIYFHKEVSFIDGRNKECAQTNFWILRKNSNISTIQPFEKKNPIHSSYELLWQELKENENKSSLTIQNIMRRIIENYFKLLGKYGDDDLIQKFSTVEEKKICSSLISWINDGSHCVNDDLYIEAQEQTIEVYRKTFKNIFVFMGHEEHYNMMMK